MTAAAETAAPDLVELCDRLNAHLQAGGAVQVTTYTRSTIYTAPHAGWFTTDTAGDLYVRRGRTRDCLSCGGRLLVGVRLSR